ncbi:MAG: hypothetical protein ABEJ43_02330 [Haloferacaceae archaeon]
MGGRAVSLSGIAIYGTASTDFVVRVSAELLGFGRSFGLFVPFILTGRLVLGLNTIGWALGWMLLWLVLFLYGPLFFPPQGETSTDWTLGVPNRLLVATAAVGVGITLESWLTVLESQANYGGIVSSPVYVPPGTALGLLGATLLGHFVVGRLPPTSWAVSRLRTTPRPEEGHVTPDRYLLAVVFLGGILAVVAVLFPLPELLVMAFGAGSVVASVAPLTAPGVYLLAIREDLTQGLLGGAVAVWQDLEDVFHLVYILAPLLWFWLFAAGTIHILDLRTAVARSPLSLFLVLGTLGVAGGHVTLFAFRLSLRIRARARGEEPPPLVPLFLLPLGLAMFVPLAIIISSGIRTPNSLARLTFTRPLAALALLSIALSVVTVLRPAAFPLTGPDANDRATAAIATAVTLTLSVFAGVYSTSVLQPDARFAAARVVVGMTVFALVVSSLWWGSRIFLPADATTDRTRLKVGIVRAGAGAVAGLVLSAVSVATGLLYQPGILRLGVSYALSLLVLTSGLNLVLYVFVYPFRFVSTPG